MVSRAEVRAFLCDEMSGALQNGALPLEFIFNQDLDSKRGGLAEDDPRVSVFARVSWEFEALFLAHDRHDLEPNALYPSANTSKDYIKFLTLCEQPQDMYALTSANPLPALGPMLRLMRTILMLSERSVAALRPMMDLALQVDILPFSDFEVSGWEQQLAMCRALEAAVDWYRELLGAFALDALTADASIQHKVIDLVDHMMRLEIQLEGYLKQQKDRATKGKAGASRGKATKAKKKAPDDLMEISEEPKVRAVGERSGPKRTLDVSSILLLVFPWQQSNGAAVAGVRRGGAENGRDPLVPPLNFAELTPKTFELIINDIRDKVTYLLTKGGASGDGEASVAWVHAWKSRGHCLRALRPILASLTGHAERVLLRYETAPEDRKEQLGAVALGLFQTLALPFLHPHDFTRLLCDPKSSIDDDAVRAVLGELVADMARPAEFAADFHRTLAAPVAPQDAPGSNWAWEWTRQNKAVNTTGLEEYGQNLERTAGDLVRKFGPHLALLADFELSVAVIEWMEAMVAWVAARGPRSELRKEISDLARKVLRTDFWATNEDSDKAVLVKLKSFESVVGIHLRCDVADPLGTLREWIHDLGPPNGEANAKIPALTKTTYPAMYRLCWMALTEALSGWEPKSGPPDADASPPESLSPQPQLKDDLLFLNSCALEFTELMMVTQQLSDPAEEKDSKVRTILRAVLATAMRNSKPFLEAFLKPSRMEWLKGQFGPHRKEVEAIIMALQRGTRQAQRVCAHVKTMRDKELTKHLAATRRILETFVNVTQPIFTKHKAAGWVVGVLAPKSLAGGKIESKSSASSASDNEEGENEEDADDANAEEEEEEEEEDQSEEESQPPRKAPAKKHPQPAKKANKKQHSVEDESEQSEEEEDEPPRKAPAKNFKPAKKAGPSSKPKL